MPSHQCRSPQRGSVTLIIGPMFSGKTTELLRMHTRQVIAKKKCVLVKYAGDDRYDSDKVATHSKQTGDGLTAKAYRLSDVVEEMFDPTVDVVAIDEGQFFPDLSPVAEELARRGKAVYVAALNGTFERKPFEQIALLLSLADEVRRLSAVCVECGADASYSFRCNTDKKVEVIGGSDTYKALCRDCYYEQSALRDGEENTVPAPKLVLPTATTTTLRPLSPRPLEQRKRPLVDSC